MDRIHHPSAIATPPPVDAHATPGYPTDGNPGGGIEATIMTAYIGHSIIEEMRNVIVAAGVTPDKADLTQLNLALSSLFGWGKLTGPRIFTVGGTYVPTPGTTSAFIEALAGGGAGGGIAATGAGAAGAGSGGSAGSYGMLWLPSGVAPQTITIGAGGAGVSGANGGNGGVTSFGALISCPGGLGGLSGAGRSAAGVSAQAVAGGAPPSGASLGNGGAPSGSSIVLSASSALSGAGAPTRFGGGGTPAGLNATSGIAGNPGGGFGSGGSGACAVATGSSFKGGDGAPGLVIVWEFQ